MQKKKYMTLSILITIAFLALGMTVFAQSCLRTIEAIGDLVVSVKYYIYEIIGIEHNVDVSVTRFSKVLGKGHLPETLKVAKEKAIDYITLLISAKNLKGYVWSVTKGTVNLARVISIILPILICAIKVLKSRYMQPNNNYDKDSKPLRIYKGIVKHTYEPIMRFVISYREYLEDNKSFKNIWLWLWLINCNLMSILLSGISYYLYFVLSFDVVSIYRQVCKLIIDLEIIVDLVPWWVIGIIAWKLFNNWRERIATRVLQHHQARNFGFVKELPIVSMTVGSMGMKKTTVITDMALSEEVMLRQMALEILQRNDMKFPNFPWIRFEKDIQRCMEYGVIYNLASIKVWIKKKAVRYRKYKDNTLQLYDYDTHRYGMVYNNGIKQEELFEVLSMYAQAYFIYIIQSSLIVSNYAIRTSNVYHDEGNFPVWTYDFFNIEENTKQYSKILDFDVLRLGKKVIENNKNAGSFEFGVVVITEVGKERGNNLELKEVKKNTEQANQKNDLFNVWLKMCRHSATVDNYPFIKVFTDEQRPESWGSDAREVGDILRIVSTGEQKHALPMYIIEEMLSEKLFEWFMEVYYNFRYTRGDNTLFIYLLKKLTAWIYARNIRVYNRFGYSRVRIEKERGTMIGKVEKKVYYLDNAKIYAERFTTDCFSEYFNELARKSKVGIKDYIEYETVRASVEELKLQNSYFIRSLYGR